MKSPVECNMKTLQTSVHLKPFLSLGDYSGFGSVYWGRRGTILIYVLPPVLLLLLHPWACIWLFQCWNRGEERYGRKGLTCHWHCCNLVLVSLGVAGPIHEISSCSLSPPFLSISQQYLCLGCWCSRSISLTPSLLCHFMGYPPGRSISRCPSNPFPSGTLSLAHGKLMQHWPCQFLENMGCNQCNPFYPIVQSGVIRHSFLLEFPGERLSVLILSNPEDRCLLPRCSLDTPVT